MSANDQRICFKNLWKIFGPNPEQALAMAKAGASKAEILSQSGHVLGLHNINLEVGQGEFFVVMGLSGSGKSTLIRHINRIIRPTAGEVRVDGENLNDMDEEDLTQFRRRRVSMVFQRFALLPHRTVLENIAYGLRVRGVATAERRRTAEYWVERVGLSGYEDRHPRQLSGGMQQRVGLARALATDADILLMDEPFSALDPLIRDDMQAQLLELQGNLRKTVFFITHDLDEAFRLGERVAVMEDGGLLQVGKPDEILLRPCNEHVGKFLGNVDRSKVLTAKSIMAPALMLRLDDIGATPPKVNGAENIYIVDETDRLLGVVAGKDAEKLTNRSAVERSMSSTPTVGSDVPLRECCRLAAGSLAPMAVLSEAGVVLGEVSPRAVLEALGR